MTSAAPRPDDAPLPTRDRVLLPLLSLLTVLGIISALELGSRLWLAESATTTLKCLVINDATTGVRAIPNTTCTQKSAEGELDTYQINSCGHRAGMECQPKAADTYRIVLVGSSYAYGMWVPREKSFAALMPAQLSQLTGRHVELYNEGMQWAFPRVVNLQFQQALDAQPDLILWPVTPKDIHSVDEILPWSGPPPEAAQDPHNGLAYRLLTAWHAKSPSEFVADAWTRLSGPLNNDHAVLLLQHEIFQSQSQFVKQYLMQADSDYLHAQYGASLANHLALFETHFKAVQAKAASIGAPVVVVLLPERAQAAMISMQHWPDGYDPYKLGNELKAIVTRQGGTYLDVLPRYGDIPNPEQDFLPVDGHPNADGHAKIAGLLSQALAAGVITPQTASR